MCAQHLHHRQHQIRRRRADGHFAGQFETDDMWQKHIDRLAQHHRLGLDPTDAPAQDTQTVDHRGVTICTNQAIREKRPILLLHHLRQIFQVDLVHDAGGRRHDAEIVERLLAPTQKFVALAVALELARGVHLQRLTQTVVVNLHRMVDDQIHRD